MTVRDNLPQYIWIGGSEPELIVLEGMEGGCIYLDKLLRKEFGTSTVLDQCNPSPDHFVYFGVKQFLQSAPFSACHMCPSRELFGEMHGIFYRHLCIVTIFPPARTILQPTFL